MSIRQGIEILIVEDNDNDAELALRALRRHNPQARTAVARDGEEALEFLFATGRHAERAREPLPRVVLLDLKMPKLDGFELLQRLRSEPGTRRLPVVVLTASQEERDIVRAYELGANSYVVKPMDFDDFTRTISALGHYWAVTNRVPVEEPR